MFWFSNKSSCPSFSFGSQILNSSNFVLIYTVLVSRAFNRVSRVYLVKGGYQDLQNLGFGQH